MVLDMGVVIGLEMLLVMVVAVAMKQLMSTMQLPQISLASSTLVLGA
jgi:hypothetical protein